MSSDSVSVDIEVVGAEQAISSIEDFVKALEGIEKVSQIDLSGITDGFDTIVQSGGEVIKVLDDVVKSAEGLEPAFQASAEGASELGSSMGEVNTVVKEGQTTMDDFAGTLDTTATGIDTVSTSATNGTGSMNELAAATTEEAASAEELASGISPLGQLIEDTATATGGLNTALVENTSQLTETAGAAGEANAAISELGPIFSDAGTTAAGASESFTTFVGEAGALGDALQAVEGPLTESNTLMENLATTTPDATGAMTELGDASEQMGSQVESSAGTWQTLDSSMGATIGFMGSAASGAIGLVQGFVRLEQAQNRVQASTLKVSKSQEALGKAQQKLNALRASGTASAAELAQAELDVSQASEALSLAQGRLEIQQTNLNLKMASFYAEIAPNIISAVTGTIAGISQMPGAFGKVSQALGLTKTSTDEFSVSADGASLSSQELGIDLGETEASALNLGGTAQAATGSITGMGGSMSTAGKAFAVGGGIILVASAAIAVISTNAFGARDALNQFGESLGNAVPPLEGLLVGIQNLAVDIGIAGDDAKASVEDFRSLEEQVVGMGEGLVTTGQHLQEVDSRFKTTGAAVEELGNTVSTVGPHLIRETSTWGDAINKFADAIARRDWDAAFDLIIVGIESVGAAIWDSVQIAGDAINVGYAAQFDALVEIVTIAAGLIYEGLTRIWDSIVSYVGGKVDEVVAAINKMASDVSIPIEAWWNATNLKKFLDEAVPAAQKAAADIAAALKIQPVPGAPTLVPETATVEGRPTAREADSAKALDIQTQAAKRARAEEAALNASVAEMNKTGGFNAIVMEGVADSTQIATNAQKLLDKGVTSSSANYLKYADQVKLSANGSKNFAETQAFLTKEMGNVGANVAVLHPELSKLTAAGQGVTGNFLRAAQVMPGFNEALVDQRTGVSELDPKWQQYNDAIQVATDRGITMSDTILKSVPATLAYGQALESNTGQQLANLGAAQGYIDAMSIVPDITNPAGQSTVNFAAALKAGADELTRVTTGQQEANAATRGVQAAYEVMTPAVLNQAVANQQEAQSLALGNILKADSNRATVALAEAQTQGTVKGVEFANSQFTAQASLTGYRQALSEAVFGNTEYGNSLGMTTGQLERQLSFQNDVVTAQEEIIDSGAQLVDSQVVQAEAWRTMSDEQLNNINTSNRNRVALIALKNPLADTADNVQAMNEAFISGGEAANEFTLGLRTSSAETDGYKQRLQDANPALQQFGDTAQYTTEQMERLATAFSGTSAGLRAMTGDMLAASDSFMGMLKFDPEVLHTKIDDAFAEVPQWIQDTMSEGLKGGIVAQGDIQRLGKQFVDMTGAAIVGAFRTDNPFEQLRPFAESMLQTFDELDPQVAAALAPMKKHFQDIANIAQVNLPPTVQQLEKLGQAFTGAAVEAEKAADPFFSFYTSLGGVKNVTPEAAANIATLDGGLKSLSEQGMGASLGLAGVGEAAKAGQVPMVELTNSAGQVVGSFANINGQLIPVQGAMGDTTGTTQALTAALTAMGLSIEPVSLFAAFWTEKLNAMSTSTLTFRNNVNAAFVGMLTDVQTIIPPITAFAAFMTTSFNALSVSILTFRNNTNAAFIGILTDIQTIIPPITAFSTFMTTSFNALSVSILTFRNNTNVAFIGILTDIQTVIPVITAFSAFMTTSFNALSISILTFRNNVNAAFIGMLTDIQTIIPAVTAWAAFMTTSFNAISVSALTLRNNTNAAFLGILTDMQTMISGVQAWATGMTTAFNTISTSALTLRNNIQQMAADIQSSFDEVTSAATSMATSVTGSFNTTSDSALTLRNNIQQLADDFGSAMEEMTSHVESFADAFSGAMDTLIQSANDAQQAVEDLQSAIDNLKDKTVTVTVNYKRTGVTSFQHGGSFIVDKPTTMGGMKMGEHSKPELVTVTPLTNPNRNSEKTIDASRFMSAATTTTTGMQRGGRFVNAPTGEGDTQELFKSLIAEVRQMRVNFRDMKIMSTTVLDSQIIDQRIQQRRVRRTENFG